MTGANGVVEVRWLPGLGCSPGAIDLTTVGPMGRIARAVTLPEALAASVVIDLLCPGSNWCETMSQLAPALSPTRRGTP